MATPISLPSTTTPTIIPAQLGFLAIYNPSLGATDETIDDQIVYYASVDHDTSQQQHSGRRRRNRNHGGPSGRPTESLSKDERNERLRSIGLAQGMVEFGKSFSGGRPVDSIDTEKSRVVLHELEPGWWILASVDLTRLPGSSPGNSSGGGGTAVSAAGKGAEGTEPEVEYSSREVKPAALLLRDLMRAHSVFLLHHDSSLSALFVRTQRDKFVSILGRYWDMFLASWNVMLHGNPACDMFAGIKIAASGELGFGVGEEDRGSGEREVLEGLVGGVEGLVDLVVGRYGEAEFAASEEPEPWLGTGRDAGAEDGAIFLGVGALSRYSTRAITSWMEDLYTYGENAYGVLESPTSTRVRPRRKRKHVDRKPSTPIPIHQPPPPGLPAHVPPGSGLQGLPPPVTSRDTRRHTVSAGDARSSSHPPAGAEEGEAGMSKLFGYLKMGYGTSWTLGTSPHSEQVHVSHEGETPPARSAESGARKGPGDGEAGRFLVGLVGDVEERPSTPSESDETRTPNTSESPAADLHSRNRLRTIIVELESEGEKRLEADVTKDLGSQETELAIQKADYNKGRFSETASTFDSQDRNKTKKLRVVVYVHKPFIFVLLFHLHTDSLAWDGFYRSLHHQLAPLQKGLLASTAYRPGKPDNVASAAVTAQIYDLIWDPRDLTVHSTIPSIPEPGPAGAGSMWSRIEALNTHSQILNIFLTTRDDDLGFEKTCKTSRGWWVVWNRVLEERKKAEEVIVVERADDDGSVSGSGAGASHSDAGGRESDDDDDQSGNWDDNELNVNKARKGGGMKATGKKEMIVSKEIFLIRKASDHSGGGGSTVGGMLRGVGASYGAGLGSGSPGASGGYGGGGWADGASRLAQGIGVDTRRYIEGLLSLNR
ncbi:hypothetical protein V8F06_010744 [Rhypophila decipiens]